MDLKKHFEDFWRDKECWLSAKFKNPSRFHKNLSKKMEKWSTIEEIDDYVKNSLKTARESTRQIISEFYKYLLKKKVINKIDSDLPERHYYDYAFERQLEIAKFLQTPKTMQEIEANFDIAYRTVNADLQELEEGITVLGSTIRIEKKKIGKKVTYKTSVHPLFLPLNLTEAYSMTVYLEKVVKPDDPNGMVIHDIINRMKAQLSDYAWKILYKSEPQPKVSNDYLNDEDLARSREGHIGYLMKTGKKCRFIWNGKEYIGQIVPLEKYGFPYSVVTDEGTEFDAPLSEIEFVIDDIEYE